MNVLIISDLHIGSKGVFNNFGWTAQKFIKKLEKIKKKFNIDLLVLNGDIFDLYQYKFEDIKESNPELIDYLLDKRNIYIRGNHDILNDFAHDSYTITNKCGKTIYIEHGHNADYLNGTSLGRFISRQTYWLLKLIIKFKFVKRAYYKIVEKNDMINRIPKKYNSIKYLTYALRMLKTYDVVVLGHTHKIETHKTYFLNQKKRYLNSGTCSLGRFQGIILDTESLKYETVKIPSKNELKNPLDIKVPKKFKNTEVKVEKEKNLHCRL